MIFNSTLNHDILKNLMVDQYSNTLRKSPFITNYLSEDVVKGLCQYMKQCNYQPGEIIFKAHD
jgi:hypothetical protein